MTETYEALALSTVHTYDESPSRLTPAIGWTGVRDNWHPAAMLKSDLTPFSGAPERIWFAVCMQVPAYHVLHNAFHVSA